MSPNWLEFTGMKWEQVRGFGWRNAIHPDDIAEVIRRSEKAWKSGQPYLAVFRVRHYTGKYFWMVAQAVPVFDAHQQIVGLRGWNDVLPLDSIADPASMTGISPKTNTTILWNTGPDKGCTNLNEAWREITGRNWEQDQGFGWAEAIHPDDIATITKAYNQAWDEKRPFARADETGIEIVDLRNFNFKKDEEEQS